MLHLRRHWHIAFERNPEREARLLCVNASNANAGNSDDDRSADTEEQALQNLSRAANEDRDEYELQRIRESARTPEDPDRPLVETVQENTRNRTEGVLGANGNDADNEHFPHSESVEETFKRTEKLSEKVPDFINSIEMMIRLMKERSGLVENSAYLIENWQKIKEELESIQGPLAQARTKATALKAWKDGKTPPPAFLRWLAVERKNPESQEETSGAEEDKHIKIAKSLLRASEGRTAYDAETGQFPDLTLEEEWPVFSQLHSTSTQRTAIEVLSEAANLEQEIHDINTAISPIESAIDDSKMEDRMNATIERLLTIDIRKEKISKNFLPSIEFYSILDYYNGAKGWWDSMKKAFENKSKLKQGKIQYAMSRAFKFLPYGEEAEIEGRRTVDSQHRSQRGEYKEDLQDRQPKFLAVFGPGGEFDEAIGRNPDLAMGILEYAADRGWLYTLKESGYVVNGRKLLPKGGKPPLNIFPQHWDENRIDIYLDNLVGQNQSGYDKEKSSNHDSVKKRYTKKKEFLNDFESYFNDVNLPAAHGIMEAMLERAIDADEDGHVAAKFFRIIRNNYEVRKFLTPSIIQDFSRATAGKGTLAMTNLFMDREKLGQQARLPEADFNMKHAGSLATAIARIEGKIYEADPSLKNDTDKVDALVAQVLVGKPVIVKNQTISIWTDDLLFYRQPETNPAMSFTNAESVRNTEMDYYNSDATYEMLIANQAFWTEVMRTGSPQKWENPDQARAMVGKVLLAYKTMREKYGDGPDSPAEKMRMEVGAKIQSAMQASIRQSEQLYSIPLRIGGKEVQYTDPNTNKRREVGAVAALEVMGFISLDDMGEKGVAVKAQCQDEISRLLQLDDSVIPKGGRAYGKNRRGSVQTPNRPAGTRGDKILRGQTPNMQQAS